MRGGSVSSASDGSQKRHPPFTPDALARAADISLLLPGLPEVERTAMDRLGHLHRQPNQLRLAGHAGLGEDMVEMRLCGRPGDAEMLRGFGQGMAGHETVQDPDLGGGEAEGPSE